MSFYFLKLVRLKIQLQVGTDKVTLAYKSMSLQEQQRSGNRVNYSTGIFLMNRQALVEHSRVLPSACKETPTVNHA